MIGVPPLRLCVAEVHLGGGSPLRLIQYPPGGWGVPPEVSGGRSFLEIFSGGRARRRREILAILSGGKTNFH